MLFAMIVAFPPEVSARPLGIDPRRSCTVAGEEIGEPESSCTVTEMATPFPKSSFSELPLSWQNTARGTKRRTNSPTAVSETSAISLCAQQSALLRALVRPCSVATLGCANPSPGNSAPESSPERVLSAPRSNSRAPNSFSTRRIATLDQLPRAYSPAPPPSSGSFVLWPALISIHKNTTVGAPSSVCEGGPWGLTLLLSGVANAPPGWSPFQLALADYRKLGGTSVLWRS